MQIYFGFAFAVAVMLAIPITCSESVGGPLANHSQPGLPVQSLRIEAKGGPVRLDVEVARTPEQQEAGLMFRKSVSRSGGMIFPFHPAKDVAFWMKNTLIPLDMLFIRADGTIARIVTARPLDRTPQRANEPVAAVLEIGAGRAKALGIKEGDRVSWRGLSNKG